jgi:hypothetical protein
MNSPVAVQDGILRLHDIDVTDEVTITYIARLEPHAQLSAVVNCLQLGARALTFASDQTGATLVADALRTSADSTGQLLKQVSLTAQHSMEKSTEALQKNVGQLLVALGKELERSLDPANAASIIGKLRNALLDDYRKVTSKVREDLDLANPLSPLSALRSELEKADERRFETLSRKIGELLQQHAAKTAAHEERLKSTRKGLDFEEATENFLTAESRPRKDLVRRTGTEVGFDKNNVGDFVIELNPSEGRSLRIVIESKNAHKTTTGLVRELDKAMKNRCAAFGISVVTDHNTLSQSIIPFGDDKLIVRVPPLLDGNGWDFTALAVALEGARWKTIMGRTTAGTLDVKRVKGEVDAAFVITNRFIEAKKKITASKTYLDGISEYLDDLRRDLQATLQRIRDAVAAADANDKAA